MKRQHKQKILAALAAFYFLFLSAGIAQGGMSAPDFSLRDLKQRIVSLGDYRAKKPVILFFWATWCPFCRKEIKNLNENYSRLAGDGVVILAVNIGERPDKVNKFIKNSLLLYPVLLDLDTNVASSYGVRGIPTYVFIDKKGEIIYSDHSFSDQQYKTLLGSK